MSTPVAMHQCWIFRCLERVPDDSDHIGLCDRHRDSLREDDWRSPTAEVA